MILQEQTAKGALRALIASLNVKILLLSTILTRQRQEWAAALKHARLFVSPLPLLSNVMIGLARQLWWRRATTPFDWWQCQPMGPRQALFSPSPSKRKAGRGKKPREPCAKTLPVRGEAGYEAWIIRAFARQRDRHKGRRNSQMLPSMFSSSSWSLMFFCCPQVDRKCGKNN